MDCKQVAAWLASLAQGLNSQLQAMLKPMAEQAKRNDRALVFVPALLLNEGVNVADRSTLFNCIKDVLATGNYDIKGRTPRVRWERNAEERARGKISALAHRLRERITRERPQLEEARWRVQRGGGGAEAFYTRVSDGRSRLVFSVNADMALVGRF